MIKMLTAEIKPFLSFLPRLFSLRFDDSLAHTGFLFFKCAQVCRKMLQGKLFYFGQGSVALNLQ